MHGHEIMKYNDGFYEGEFIYDKREGKGKKTWTDGPSKGDVYDGEWKNDKMHGKGIYKYHNGKEYNGEWNCGDMHGWGIMKYTDGYYEGNGNMIKGMEKAK